MTDTPNPEDFSYVDTPNEYRVTLTVTGEITLTIKAADPEQAQVQAKQQAEAMYEEPCVELDTVEDVDIGLPRKAPRMYRVTDADGNKLQVSRLRAGMTPREPDERGF